MLPLRGSSYLQIAYASFDAMSVGNVSCDSLSCLSFEGLGILQSLLCC